MIRKSRGHTINQFPSSTAIACIRINSNRINLCILIPLPPPPFTPPTRSTFEIINVDESQTKNKTPVVHVMNHLGLESWCIRLVYHHAHQIILAAVKKHPSDGGGGGSGGDSPLAHHKPAITTATTTPGMPHPFNHTLVKYLNFALLINPDVTTFWNARRRLLQKDRLDIGREFKFSAIVLSKKPKSNEAFSYRRWLYSFQSHESIDWTRELSLTERCSAKSLSNYQAWSHRQWALQKAPFLLQYELATTERFIRKHIGDYSCYSHRQFVLFKMYELGYFEHDINADTNYAQYSALIGCLGGIEALADPEPAAGVAAWKWLMRRLAPHRDFDGDGAVARAKTFLYCMNVAAYDLRFVDELRQMFGEREAFDCHRWTIAQFMVDKCAEWSVAPAIGEWCRRTLEVVRRAKQHRRQAIEVDEVDEEAEAV